MAGLINGRYADGRGDSLRLDHLLAVFDLRENSCDVRSPQPSPSTPASPTPSLLLAGNVHKSIDVTDIPHTSTILVAAE